MLPGDVWWLNASDAFTQKLAYVNDAGNAIMKVDNTSNVPFNEKRNTVSFLCSTNDSTFARFASRRVSEVGPRLWVGDTAPKRPADNTRAHGFRRFPT